MIVKCPVRCSSHHSKKGINEKQAAVRTVSDEEETAFIRDSSSIGRALQREGILLLNALGCQFDSDLSHHKSYWVVAGALYHRSNIKFVYPIYISKSATIKRFTLSEIELT